MMKSMVATSVVVKLRSEGWLGKGTWNGVGGFWNCKGFELCVRSNVTSRNGVEAEIVCTFDDNIVTGVVIVDPDCNLLEKLTIYNHP
ncbi:unnamed protein product [Dovyalis caffra]|uniref:Uncharacterized protein n=1 Tax=Dovyalis caffra TaxID=77055 RepID=A0AAV1SRW9_9ROSI|nr:unnamed protein product [Dovyalis caffra]